jgi:RNA polymerase sigma-70 factor (ECF subfamily)
MTSFPNELRRPATPEAAPGREFLELFLQHERRLYAYIYTLWPHHGDAEDLLQEVSLFMWDHYDRANPPPDFVGWACRIAYFKVLDLRKLRQRSRVVFSQEVLERVAATASEQGARLDDRREALAACLEKLGANDRDLFTWRLESGATTESTAERAGRSVHVVYKALARIREALFDCVSRRLAAEAGS